MPYDAEANARYRAANPEKVKAADHAWRVANREKIAERKRAYYAANAERLCADKRARYHATEKEAKVECPLCHLCFGRKYLAQHQATRHKLLPPTAVVV